MYCVADVCFIISLLKEVALEEIEELHNHSTNFIVWSQP